MSAATDGRTLYQRMADEAARWDEMTSMAAMAGDGTAYIRCRARARAIRAALFELCVEEAERRD